MPARIALISRELWRRARQEESAPRKIGWSVAIGVFAGCTPFLGFHAGVAVSLATVLRLNRLWAVLGSRVSFTPVFVLLTFCEVQIAHRLRTGIWLPLAVRAALARGNDFIVDWFLGSALVGTTLGAVAGLLAYEAARRRQQVNALTRGATLPRS